jgi:hypothetical protein
VINTNSYIITNKKKKQAKKKKTPPPAGHAAPSPLDPGRWTLEAAAYADIDPA